MATAKKSPKKPGDVKSGGSDGVSESRQPVAKKSEEPIVSSVPGFSDNIRLGNEGPALFGKSAGIAVVNTSVMTCAWSVLYVAAQRS